MVIMRLKPEQIQAGRSYQLMPRYIHARSIVRKVEAIRDGNVIVKVGDKEVRMPVKEFAALAVEEVKGN